MDMELKEHSTGKEPQKNSSSEGTGLSAGRSKSLQAIPRNASLDTRRCKNCRTFDKKIPFVDPNKGKKFKDFWAKREEKLKSHYVNYALLKQQLKRLTRKDWSSVSPSTFWQSDSGLFDERVGATILKLSAPEIEFFASFEREKNRLNKYIMSKMNELEETIYHLYENTRSAKENMLDKITQEADEMCEETRALHAFIHQNKVAYRKLMDVYEKKTVSRGSWILVQLEKQPFWNLTVDHLIATLSDIYKKIYAIRMRTTTQNDLNVGKVQTFERKTFKFWVRPEHVVAVKLLVLKHLPVQIFDKRPPIDESIPRDFSDSSIISSIYFDNNKFDMYYGRLIEGKGRGNLIRIRWYGSSLNPTPEVFIECKTRKKVAPSKAEASIEGVAPKEKFEAIKERFKVKRGHVFDYISGKNTVEKKIEKMVNEGTLHKEDATTTIDMASEIQTEIVQKQLKPYLRTVYRRTAFQRGEQLKEGWYRDYDENIDVPDVILFPYAVLEIKLQEEPPEWINTLIASGYLIPGYKFSKFTHGIAEFFTDELTQFPRWWYVLHPDSSETNTSLEPTRELSLADNESADAEAKDQPMKRSVTFDPKLRSPSIDSRTSSSGSVEQKKGFGFFNRRPSDATRKNSDAKKPTEAPRKESDAPRKQSDAPRKDSDAQSKSSEASTNGEVSPNLTPEGGIRKSILQILNEPEDPNEDVLTRDKKQRKKKKLRKCLDALAEGGKYTITDDYVWYEPPNKKDKKKDVDDEEAQEQNKNKAKKGTERDPKVYFANERTLLSWLNMVTFLAIAAISLLSFGQSMTQIAGLTLVPLSLVFSIYALIRYHFRAQGIRRGIMQGIDDKVGPYVFTVLLCATLIITTAFSFTYGAIPANSVTLRIERGVMRIV